MGEAGYDDQVQASLQGEVVDNETAEGLLNICNGVGEDGVRRYTRAFLLMLQESPLCKLDLNLDLFERDENGQVIFAEQQPEPPVSRPFRDRPGSVSSLSGSFDLRPGRGRAQGPQDKGRWGRDSRDGSSMGLLGRRGSLPRLDGEGETPSEERDLGPQWAGESAPLKSESKGGDGERIVLGPQRSMLFACATKGSEGQRRTDDSRQRDRPEADRRNSLLGRSDSRGTGGRLAERSDSFPSRGPRDERDDRDRRGGERDWATARDRQEPADRDAQGRVRTGEKYVIPADPRRALGPSRTMPLRGERMGSLGERDRPLERFDRDRDRDRGMGRPTMGRQEAEPEWLTYAPESNLETIKLQGLPEREGRKKEKEKEKEKEKDSSETPAQATPAGKTLQTKEEAGGNKAAAQEPPSKSEGQKTTSGGGNTGIDTLLHSEFFRQPAKQEDHPLQSASTSAVGGSRFSDLFGSAMESDFGGGSSGGVDGGTSRFSNLFGDSVAIEETSASESRFQHLFFSEPSTPAPSSQPPAAKVDVLQLFASIGVAARSAGPGPTEQQPGMRPGGPPPGMGGMGPPPRMGGMGSLPGMFAPQGPPQAPPPASDNGHNMPPGPMPYPPFGHGPQPQQYGQMDPSPSSTPAPPQHGKGSVGAGPTPAAGNSGKPTKHAVAFNGFTPTSVLKAAGKKKGPEAHTSPALAARPASPAPQMGVGGVGAPPMGPPPPGMFADQPPPFPNQYGGPGMQYGPGPYGPMYPQQGYPPRPPMPYPPYGMPYPPGMMGPPYGMGPPMDHEHWDPNRPPPMPHQ